MPTEAKPRLRGVFHQWAFMVSLVAGAVLVAGAPTGRAAAVGAVYAVALAGMFGASALYHRVAWRPALLPWFRRLDHSMIFVLIAGTCTPVVVLSLEGVLPIVVLIVLWGGALAGVLLKLVWLGAPRWLGRRSTSCSGGSGSCCCRRRCAPPASPRPPCSSRAERSTRRAR